MKPLISLCRHKESKLTATVFALLIVVRAPRIELGSQPWEGRILPLNHARIFCIAAIAVCTLLYQIALATYIALTANSFFNKVSHTISDSLGGRCQTATFAVAFCGLRTAGFADLRTLILVGNDNC